MKAKFYTLVAALAMLCHFQKATAQTVQITCSVFGNTVRACDTAVYVFSVTNFNKAFTITNIFSGAVTSAQLSATGSNFSLSGNNIVVNSFSGAAQTCTLKVYVACNAIPNSGSSNSFNDTVGISGWSSGNYNINGTPNNTSKIVNATFVYPNLDNSNTSTANVIVSPCKPDTLRLSYTNGGLSKFKGVVRFYNPVCTGFSVSTMRVFRRVGSNSTVVATLSNPYNNSTYRDVYFTNDTIGNLEQVEVEYVIGMSCTNGCINSATGVFPLTFNCAAQCAHDAQIKWGCDTNQLCKTTLKPIVIHPVIDSLPKLRLTRITPSPAANLGSVVGVWDAKCSGEDTEWKFLVENTGAGSCAIARNVVLSLFNNALDTNNNTYTRIVPGSIHILQDSVGGVALTLPAIPSSVVLDTVTVANPYTVFNASDLIESDCFSNSTGIITNYVVRIPELMPGQRLVLRFITRRCCASVSPFNTPIVYNRWQLSLTAKNYCGTGNNLAVNDSAHTLGTDSLYEPFVYQNNSPVKNAISNNFLENSSDLLLTQTLHAPTFVLMGGKGSCGPYINFEIANREFPTDKLNVYHGDTELFTHCSGPVTQSVAYGGFAGAMPRGLFTVQIPVPSGIDYDANTPAPLFKGTLSNGSIVNWTPQSWNPTANPPEAVFDIAQVANILGANFTTHDFRVFFLRSIFIFPLRACCPTSTNHADFAVNTFFTPRISCDSTTTNCQCRIPLSSVPVSVQLLCPGCVTPGMALGSYTLRRNTFGYTDSNDDRIADGSSPTTINPNTYPQASLLNTGASLAGDEIIAEADGWFQEGDDGTGFSYASWQNYWSQFSTDTVLTHLYLEQEAAHGATAGLQVNGTSTVVMLRDTGNGNWVQIGDTVHFANDTAHWQILNAANGKKLLTCHVTANEFHSTAVFKENDRFVWRIPYRVCKNTTGDTATTLQVSARLYLTLGAVSMPHGYYAGVPEVGAVYETAIDTLSPIPTPHAQFVPPSNNVLFFCQGNGWLHNVYPVVQETEENWETKNQCENIGWLIFKEKIAGAYPNLFRFEVRTLPDVQTLANGPAMSAAPFANIPVAYRVKLPNGFGYDQNLPTGSPAFLTSIHTRAPGWVNPLNPDILQSVVYPAASNSPIVYPAIHPTDSQRTYYINLSQTQYTVPTVSGIGGNYTTTPPPPDQDGPFPQQITVNGKKGLLLGDEEFYQAALFKLRAICSSSDTLANIGKMFPSDNYIIAKQIDSCSGAGNGSWGLTQPTAAIQIPIPNPNITASLGNSSSQTPNIDGFYADLPFKVVVPPNAVENVIIYIDLPPTAVVQPVCLSTGAGCTGTVYPPNTTTNGWLRYSIGAKPNGTFPFWLRVQTLGCDSGIVKFNAHISWDCDGEPLNLPPLPTMCSTPDTLSFSYLRPQVQTTATATGNPTTFNGCSPTTYKACLTSTKLGGVGHISATVNFGTAAHLLSTVTADSLKVNGTTLPLAHTTNTTSLLYNLTTNSGHNISQFTPPASLLHNDGLNNNDGELCLYFNIHPQCNDTIIPALKVTFSYVRYCQLSTSLSDSVTIPLRKIAVTAAGAFDGCVTLPMLTLTESCALYPTLSVAPTGLVNYAWAVPTGQSAPCPNSQSCTVTSINPQVQGTYIVTVTYSTAPLCTRTTQLAANTSSVGIAVGSGVGLPTVSSAMAAGALLPPATAATTPQHIRLLGTLTVDTNYTFKATTTDSSTIYCMGGAEIIVNSGRTLTLSGNTTTRRVILQGCDTLWRGINVADSNLTTGLAGGQIISNYATIRDAQYGLHLHHGSRLSVKRTNFTHCFVGIFFNPDSLPTGTIPIVYYTPGQFLGNSFDGLSPLFKIPYNGMVNATGQPVTDTVRVVMRPWAGMHLKNLAEFTMGGGVPNTVDRNHFDHLENGVIITNGDLTVFNARFYRMGRGFVSPTLPPTNSGIRYQYASHLDGCAIRATSTDTISGGYPAHSLFIRGGDTLKLTATTYTIIPDTVNWFILSANWGVYSSNMNVNIGGCRIAGDLLRGIEVRNAPLAVIKIGKVRNKIEPRDKGIFLLNNDPTLHTEVSYNTIIPGSGNADNSPDSSYITRIAIEVQEQNNTPVGNLWIHHNDIHLNTYGTDGIILNGCKGGSTGFVPTTQVFNNSINLLSVARRRTGITATNCDSVMIKLNDVFSNPANLAPTASSNAIPTNTYPIGYDFAFTTNLFVECNRTNGLYTGMRFRGPNLFAQVRGNEFGTSAGGSTFGHRYGLRVANTATINAQAHRGNRWLGSYTSGFAAENLNVLQYTNMMFNVDSNASPIYWPTSTGLSSTFPTNGWFFNTSGSSYQCYSTNYGSSGKNNQEDEETALDTISQVIINDELSFEQYETPLIWQNEQAVYQKLQGNESLRKPGTPAASFYEAKLTSLMGEITVAEQHRQTAVQPSTDVAHALLQLQWHKDSLNEAITTLFEANGNIAAIAALTQHKAIATQQISEILPLHRTATQISVNAAKATNNNLQVSEQIENNLRLINNIYLNTVAANIDTFSSAQLDTLYYLALQCPLAGGVAVHRARGLLCGVIDTIYDDNQLCSEDGYSYKKERNLSTSKQSTHSNLQFTLMPNPAKESIALICSQQLNHLIRLSVCDFTGRIMFDELIQFNDKRFLLRLNDFITGLYLLRATDNNGLSYTSTFNVIR